MNDANRMRIIYDPFKKEIEYQWYDWGLGEYTELNPEVSVLVQDDFTKTTIQSRAYEIVEILNRDYNVGNSGLEIVFVGTKDDYSDLHDVISKYKDARKGTHIFLKPDERLYYYNSADFVMPKIKEQFSAIKATLEQYPDVDVTQLIDKYNDTVKPHISLCVMGLYSAGKSAFINSMIGAEILPSASDPTTAKVYKIFCDTKYEIRFQYDKEECVLTFKGRIYKPECGNPEIEIIKKLQDIVDFDVRHDEICYMNHALQILNQYNSDEHQISGMIEIRLPFKQAVLPVEEFDFVIYDTPGSDSASNADHFKVLAESLDKQANALPIFVTEPDKMDSTGNNEILKLIEETDSLDTANTIIIVNKADEKGVDELKKKRDKCKDLKVTKWKSTRIFFTSSIIAIASKKSEPDKAEEWLDRSMFEMYEEKESRYVSDKKKLFEFNITDRSKKDENIAYIDSSKATHLYKNSGMEAVENEITEYARRYALYEKCQKASEYLEKAIDLCAENVKKATEEQNKALQNARSKFNEKERELCDKLNAQKEKLTSYNTDFQREMEAWYENFRMANHLTDNKSDKQKLKKDLENAWQGIKKHTKNDEKTKLSSMQEYVSITYNAYLDSFSRKVNEDMESFWNSCSSLFKDSCIKIIHGSNALTSEQKQILASVVYSKSSMPTCRVEFNLRQSGVIRKKKVWFFWDSKSETVDIDACCKAFVTHFNDAVRGRMVESENNNTECFKKWTDSLITTLTQKLCEFNSGLNNYARKIDDIEGKIKEKNKCVLMLTKSKCEIDQLIDVQGGMEE